MRDMKFLSSFARLLFFVGISAVAFSKLAAQSPAPTAPTTTVAPTTPTTETRANGVVTTFASGLPTTVTFLGTAAATTDPIPVGNAVGYVNKNGIQIDPATIRPGTRMQAILDSQGGSPVVRQIMVNQE